MSSTRAPKRYTKIPATAISSSPIDENSADHDFEAPFCIDDDEECIIDDTDTKENTSISSFDGLSLDDKRGAYLSERASSKELKYLQDERFNDDVPSAEQLQSRHYQYIPPLISRVCTTNLVNDETILRIYRRLCRVDQDSDVDDGGNTLVKLVKLWVIIIGGILITHPFARWMKWEIDENYTIADFFLYDFTTVLLDILFFFVVGRMYHSQVDIDKLFPWVMFIALGCIYPSIANDFAFLRHSLSMYDMMCNWPMILFVYVVMLLVLAVALVGGLLRSHYRRKVLISRCIESMGLACIFILPFASNNNFHLHHWFGMWFLGMQANAPEWWSRAFQAYCLGSYINGLAVYGRDPILGCNMAFYRSTNANCDYMSCYDAGGGNGTHHYKSFVAPDWRTCNATEVP
eukprot:scaffold16056_cov147-Skeletonema_menzelii.AAC.5